MTKIKNTKKGMAKKTLSISLAVAMLATSNVPVWAAEFTDGSEAVFTSEAPAEVEAPVVEEAVEVPEAQVAEGYTVNTNMELKDVDWTTPLTFAKKDGVTDAEKFEVLDKNGVKVAVSKVEVYCGDSLFRAISTDDVATALGTVTMGFANYKTNKQVTIKVYAQGEVQEEVYSDTATITPVKIDDTWVVSRTNETLVYNGKLQAPTVRVTNEDGVEAQVVVKFEDEREARNVGAYDYSIEGVEENGYTGTVKGAVFTIVPATPTADNLSVAVSGTATYNGKATKPTVIVKDLYTNTVIPSSLYDVTVEDYVVGDYTKDNVTVTLKNTDGVLVNNFTAGEVPAECISGKYAVEALDLSKLGEKYEVSVATKKVGLAVSDADVTLTDKTTNKTYSYNAIIPKGETTILTENNTTPGTGKVTFVPTKAGEKNIIGAYTTTFEVVNSIISKDDVAFAKGTNVTGTPYTAKTSLTKANEDVYAELEKAVYTGESLEPLKNAFSNLVLTNSATVEEEVLVLGKDYDLVYTDNTDSEHVSGKEATVKLVFKGKYSGTISYKFAIAQAKAVVTGADIEYVPGKVSYDVVAKVVTGTDKKEVPAENYVVTTTKKATGINTNAEGIVVFENRNYTIEQGAYDVDTDAWHKKIESTVVARSLDHCTATIEGDYVYTGESVSPKLVVKDGEIVLVEGVDYVISSKTGINAGPAHVTITGKGYYTGSLTLDYTIAKANLANATVLNAAGEKDYDRAYTGVIQSPDVATVKIGNVVLKPYDLISKQGDYTITWDDNAVDVGTYNFTITATAASKNVEGEFKGTFKVVPSELTAGFAPKLAASYGNRVKETLLVSATGAYYTGKEITIDSFKTKYVLVDKHNRVLTEGKEYRLVYSNNVNAGTATVEAYGIGNYMNTVNGKEAPIAAMSYYIEAAGVITAQMVQKISDVEYAGGLAVEPEVIIVSNGKRLVQGVDYTVETKVTEIRKDIAASEVIIKGNGGYVVGNYYSVPDYNNNATLNLTASTLKWNVTKKDLANTVVTVDKNDQVIVMNGSVVVPSTEYTVAFSADGSKVTVTAVEGSAHYTGSKEQDVDMAKVGQAMISNVNVVGNRATVVLSGDVENAEGYDYVIATEEDYKNGRVDITKNQLKTSGDFFYVQKGVYYAYCHAWKRGEDGKKVFGEWSNLYQFTVTATTPETPIITNVTRSGSTVKVTYKAAKNAEGYDIVLGSARRKVNGELRPVEYGTLVKKNQTTTTVTFKNVPAGSYYVGLHAYNRTSVDNKKVFSPWANWSSKVTVR